MQELGTQNFGESGCLKNVAVAQNIQVLALFYQNSLSLQCIQGSFLGEIHCKVDF